MTTSNWIKNLPTPIAIIGLGKSGRSALTLLKAIGIKDGDLLTFDHKDASAMFTNPAELVAKSPRTLIVSPGVSLALDWIQHLVQQGAIVTSEISLATVFLTTEKIIGVTGSVGKSTVVSLLGIAAQSEDPNFFLGGNLGIPFCDYALRVFNKGPVATWIVLELSSYQLENCSHLKLDLSAITFLSANHLERYPDLISYYKTKLSITAMTKNSCVINSTSLDAVKYLSLATCPVQLINAKSALSFDERLKITLIGSHNHDNFAVAKTLAELAGWSLSAIQKMASFQGLSHRLQDVGTYHGVRFINDSKATALDSVRVAVECCLEKITSPHLLYLLLGGKDKNLPWVELSVFKKDSRIQVIFFGSCGSVAKELSGLSGQVFETLGAAIDSSLKLARAEDIVLLSPGGTSLDEFKNFEDRGDYFKTKVISYFK